MGNGGSAYIFATLAVMVILKNRPHRPQYLSAKLYRVPQKFVPLISCAITFDQNLILQEISKICFLLYRVLVFRSSVTGISPLFFYHTL